MKVTRRSALIAGTVAAVAASGLLIVGPAVARDRGPSAPGWNHMGGMMGGMMDGDRGLHRGPAVEYGTDFVATNAAGTTVQARSHQTGSVTAVSATSMTVKSADGTSYTWTISSATKMRTAAGKVTDATQFAVGTTVDIAGDGALSQATARFVGTQRPHMDRDGDRLRPGGPQGNVAPPNA